MISRDWQGVFPILDGKAEWRAQEIGGSSRLQEEQREEGWKLQKRGGKGGLPWQLQQHLGISFHSMSSRSVKWWTLVLEELKLYHQFDIKEPILYSLKNISKIGNQRFWPFRVRVCALATGRGIKPPVRGHRTNGREKGGSSSRSKKQEDSCQKAWQVDRWDLGKQNALPKRLGEAWRQWNLFLPSSRGYLKSFFNPILHKNHCFRININVVWPKCCSLPMMINQILS